MRNLGVVLAQVIVAVLAAGMIMPALLFTLPQARQVGPAVLILLVAVLFALVRLAWPSPKRHV